MATRNAGASTEYGRMAFRRLYFSPFAERPVRDWVDDDVLGICSDGSAVKSLLRAAGKRLIPSAHQTNDRYSSFNCEVSRLIFFARFSIAGLGSAPESTIF
jgi:hypothetical protein